MAGYIYPENTNDIMADIYFSEVFYKQNLMPEVLLDKKKKRDLIQKMVKKAQSCMIGTCPPEGSLKMAFANISYYLQVIKGQVHLTPFKTSLTNISKKAAEAVDRKLK